MKLKVLLLVAAFALVLPVASFAQTAGGSASGTSIGTSASGTDTGIVSPAPSPSASCAMPVNPTTASDWTSVITCLQSRINKLQQKVNSLEAQIGQRGVLPVLPSSASATAVSATQRIRGSSEDTKAVQEFLKAEGSFNYSTATGYYGPITTQAVKAFQEKEGLDATGEVDDSTLQKMQQLAPNIAPSSSSALNQIQFQNQTQSQSQTQSQVQSSNGSPASIPPGLLRQGEGGDN